MIKYFENWTNSVNLYAVGFTEVEPDALDRPDKAHIQFSLTPPFSLGSCKLCQRDLIQQCKDEASWGTHVDGGRGGLTELYVNSHLASMYLCCKAIYIVYEEIFIKNFYLCNEPGQTL